MAIDPVTGMLAGSVLSTAGNIYGANRAADAQKDAARKQAELARRNMLMQVQLQEPNRNVGYQALGDLSGALGYSMPAYTSPNALMQSQTPLKASAVKQGLKSGMSVDQLAQGGTLGALTAKNLRRLTKAGLSGDDILRLQGMGGNQQAQNPTAPTQATAQSAGGTDFSRFMDSPDYQFRRNEGTRGIEQWAASKSGPSGGNVLKALADYNSNLAAGEYDNWFNRRLNLAGVGTQATNNVAGAANNTTGALMGSAGAVGDARASGVLGTTNALTQGLQGGFNNWLGYQYLNGMGGQGGKTWAPGAAQLPGGGSISPRLPWVGG
jgi:hypothetical protein